MTKEQYRAGCVLYNTETRGCPLMSLEMCDGKTECKFRKTEQQKADAYERWRKRLNSLTDGEQDYINRKYYYGKRPWKEGKEENGDWSL